MGYEYGGLYMQRRGSIAELLDILPPTPPHSHTPLFFFLVVLHPHALDDLSPDTLHTWDPAAQMPIMPVAHACGDIAGEHWQKVVSVLSACPLQSLSPLDVQSRARRASVCRHMPQPTLWWFAAS